MGVALVASHPVHGRRRLTLEDAANVGSDPSSDLRLEAPADAHHARFLFRDNRLIVVDLRSLLGTYINGRRIMQATIVRPGDELKIELAEDLRMPTM